MPDKLRKRNQYLHTLRILGLTLIVWATLAYVVAPTGWRLYERLALPEISPLRARTSAGIPGDPLNLALIGGEADLLAAMQGACWNRADPLTFTSALGIALGVIARRPYPDAPVSTLIYLSRPEDIAFEIPIGGNPDRRHHVRFWQIPAPDPGAPPVWLGAATEDVSVGLNHLTGQFTHHIGPDIDAERDRILADLTKARAIGPTAMIPGSGAVIRGRNGEHDLFFTDGLIGVGRLTASPAGNANGTREGCRP